MDLSGDYAETQRSGDYTEYGEMDLSGDYVETKRSGDYAEGFVRGLRGTGYPSDSGRPPPAARRGNEGGRAGIDRREGRCVRAPGSMQLNLYRFVL